MRFLLMVLLVAVVGCAGDLERSVGPSAVVEEDSGVPRAKTRAEEEARAALAERGISFRVSEFLDAAALGDVSVVELFVAGGMPIDAAFGGWTALHEAARNGHLSVVEYLIDQGASVGPSVRALALRGGHGDVVLYLARAARSELDSLGIEYKAGAFRDAAAAGNLEVVKLFVQAGMSLETTTYDGPLHRAAFWGHLDVVEYLVGAGADVNARGVFGWTALHEAAAGGAVAVVEFLVAAGADVDARDDGGSTALSSAAWRGYLAVVEFLVGVGVDLEAADHSEEVDGWTALHGAAHWGLLAVVEYLVGAGADVNARSADGQTPRDMAADCSTSTRDVFFQSITDEERANCAAVVEYFDSLADADE